MRNVGKVDNSGSPFGPRKEVRAREWTILAERPQSLEAERGGRVSTASQSKSRWVANASRAHRCDTRDAEPMEPVSVRQ